MATSRSIRFKVSALLVIPLLSLAALWVFGASVTTHESLNLLAVSTMYENIGKPGDDLTIALQREHVLSAEYVGVRSEQTRNALTQQRQAVDKLRDRMRRTAQSEKARSSLSTPEMKASFDEAMVKVGQLDATRAAVDSRTIDLVALTRAFAQVPDAMKKLITSMIFINDVPLYRQSQSLTSMAYAKDRLTREQALAAGALIANRAMYPSERALFAELATTRRFLFGQGMAELDPAVRPSFEQLATSEAYTRFTALEDQIVKGDGRTLSHGVWRSVTDEVESSYQATLTGAGAALAASAEPAAISTFVRAGLAGALGLVAVIISLVVSYRVGRGLTRELGELQAAATELATVRLPRVIERLRQGENLDIAVEAPPLAVTATTTEVRAVSAAFGSVQRTAVEAAVDQARLRGSVGKAFRNLARRSQSLLQRQLKLLDGMQRRVDEPETLSDLFRVDHLSTRMRRHAESLVILSGGTPGRTFRQEVPVIDALRAAVGEVEDYTRVRVHPMPDAAIVGNAVADVIRLCAELIENAAMFSPPLTEVSVSGELVARGFVVEVEDRGLGISRAERDALNEKLSRPPEFDLADTERLGMYVIGRLAVRHGIRVELRNSPYGGTTAIILIPEQLITAPKQALQQVPKQAARLPARTERSAQKPARRPANGGVPAPAGAGLPQRVRQANLAPQLRQLPQTLAAPQDLAEPQEQPEPVEPVETVEPVDRQLSGQSGASGSSDGSEVAEPSEPSEPENSVEPQGSAATGEPSERSPEQSRALLNSLLSGWQRGRADSERDGEEV